MSSDFKLVSCRCQYGNFVPMPMPVECVCCKEIDDAGTKSEGFVSGEAVECITDHISFSTLCLNVWSLQASFLSYRYQYGTCDIYLRCSYT